MGRYLSDKFGKIYLIESTRNTPGSGDFILRTQDGLGKIMIEVKNYSHRVPGEEKEKFKRDLQQKNIKVGIFLSMQSTIANSF